MILALDAGNTNTKLAVFNDDELVMTARMPTQSQISADSGGREVAELLGGNGIGAADIDGVVVSTVAPEATKILLAGIRELFNTQPLIVNSATITGIEIKTDNPAELGVDRLVNASAAFYTYGGPVIVIDFGTATTYDVVNERGQFLGGVIAPGIGIGAEALWQKTARLPEITLEKPGQVLGTNTISSMQSGIYYGYVGQIEYLVRRLREELGTNARVIATGGLSVLFQGNTSVIDIFEPNLTLKGLNDIYRMNLSFGGK